MSQLDEHPSFDTLAGFNSGKLPDDQVDSIIDHLSTCMQCLDIVDQTFQRGFPGDASDSVPHLEAERAAQVERTLRQRIHRHDLSGQTIRLGTRAFIYVVLALLSPLFNIWRSPSRQRR